MKEIMLCILTVLILAFTSCCGEKNIKKNILLPGQKVSGTEVVYYENGFIKSQRLSSDTEINGIRFRGKTRTVYYKTGELYCGTLAGISEINGEVFGHIISQMTLSETSASGDRQLDSIVNRWMSGMRQRGMNTYTPQIRFVIYPMCFYKNGQPMYGRLQAMKKTGGLVLSNAHFVFFYENGTIKSGYLAKKTQVGGKQYTFGDRVFFSEEGSLKKIVPGRYSKK